jgi:MFS family permease
MNFAGAIPSTYYSLFVLGLGGTPFIIGIIEFISFLALASVQFPGGYLADKQGRRGLIVTFTFGLAFANLFYVLAPSWHFILVGVVLLNVFLIYQPALQAIIADSIPPEKRGIGFSLVMFANNAAAVFSPVVAGFLVLRYGLIMGMRIAYLLIVGFYLAAAVVRIRLKETLKTDSDRISLTGFLREYPKAVKQGLMVWKALPRSMLFLLFTNSASSFIFAMCIPYQVVYATKILHVEDFTWALIMMWYVGTMLLTALPSGKLADKIGRKKPLIASWVLLALFPVFFLMGNLPALLIGFLCFGTSNALFGAAYQALEADLVPQELRGKEVGCSQFITYVLMSTGGLAGGFFYQFVSPVLPFLLAFAVTVPCEIVTLFFVDEPRGNRIKEQR